jgi:hypothetical protein
VIRLGVLAVVASAASLVLASEAGARVFPTHVSGVLCFGTKGHRQCEGAGSTATLTVVKKARIIEAKVFVQSSAGNGVSGNVVMTVGGPGAPIVLPGHTGDDGNANLDVGTHYVKPGKYVVHLSYGGFSNPDIDEQTGQDVYDYYLASENEFGFRLKGAYAITIDAYPSPAKSGLVWTRGETPPVAFAKPSTGRCRTGCSNIDVYVQDANGDPVKHADVTIDVPRVATNVVTTSDHGSICVGIAGPKVSRHCRPSLTGTKTDSKGRARFVYWLPGLAGKARAQLLVRVEDYGDVQHAERSLVLNPNVALDSSHTLTVTEASAWNDASSESQTLSLIPSVACVSLTAALGPIALGWHPFGLLQSVTLDKMCRDLGDIGTAIGITRGFAVLSEMYLSAAELGIATPGLGGISLQISNSGSLPFTISGSSAFFDTIDGVARSYWSDSGRHFAAGDRLELKVYEVSHRPLTGLPVKALYMVFSIKAGDGGFGRTDNKLLEGGTADYEPDIWLDPDNKNQ